MGDFPDTVRKIHCPGERLPVFPNPRQIRKRNRERQLIRIAQHTELLPAFQLPWSHYVQLLAVQNSNARAFYEAEALRGGWSVRQLRRQIGSQFYERTALSKNKAGMLTKGTKARPEDAITARGGD